MPLSTTLKGTEKHTMREIVKTAQKHGCEDDDMVFIGTGQDSSFLQIGTSRIKVPNQGVLKILEDEGLLSCRANSSGKRNLYSLRQRGIDAVSKNFALPSLLEVDGPSIQIGDRYINVAIGTGAVAEQVLGNLGDDNPELTEAVKELAHVISDRPGDQPTVLSQLSQVIKLLSQAPNLIKTVAPIVIKALEAVGLLSQLQVECMERV